MEIGISQKGYLKEEKSSILMISNFSTSAFEPIKQELAMDRYLTGISGYQQVKSGDCIFGGIQYTNMHLMLFKKLLIKL